MIELTGKYNDCKIFTDLVDQSTISQLIELLNQPFTKDSQIRVMPDCHQGNGCVIGTTMTLKDKVPPYLTGCDIGCGVLTVKLKEKSIDFSLLDDVIRSHVPSGHDIHQTEQDCPVNLLNLKCYIPAHIDASRTYRSVGTLGGGNHFIEVDKDTDECLYLAIHTGSRHLGLEVANYYQNLAYSKLYGAENLKAETQALIKELKAQGREQEIQTEIVKLKVTRKLYAPKIPKGLAYLENDDFWDYIHDMKMLQDFARHNRQMIANTIMRHMGLTQQDSWDTIHNYIDTEHMILRKGAVSAEKNKLLMIPINMRDGILMCVGKGNEDWNCSAPHGAGRIMSRSQAKEAVNMDDFTKTMDGIFSTSVNESTKDESPFAYKPMASIVDNIKPTVHIEKIIWPIYNFKASN